MLTYPESPGYKTAVPETSMQAARAVEPLAKTLRTKCHEALKGADMTADEVAELLGQSVLAVRPRISELRRQGLVEPTLKRRCNVSGKRAAVWRAVRQYKQEELI